MRHQRVGVPQNVLEGHCAGCADFREFLAVVECDGQLQHTTEEATSDFPYMHISVLEKPMVANLHVAGLWLMR